MKSMAKIAGIFGSLLIAVLAEWALNDSRGRETTTTVRSQDEHQAVRLPRCQYPTLVAAE